MIRQLTSEEFTELEQLTRQCAEATKRERIDELLEQITEFWIKVGYWS